MDLTLSSRIFKFTLGKYYAPTFTDVFRLMTPTTKSILNIIRSPGYTCYREPPRNVRGIDLLKQIFQYTTIGKARSVYKNLTTKQKAALDSPKLDILHAQSYRVWEGYEAVEYVRQNLREFDWDPFRFLTLYASEIFKDKLARLRGAAIRDIIQQDPYDVVIKNALFTPRSVEVQAFRARARFVQFYKLNAKSMSLNEAMTSFLALLQEEKRKYELTRKITKSWGYDEEYLELQKEVAMAYLKKYPGELDYVGNEEKREGIYYRGHYVDEGLLRDVE